MATHIDIYGIALFGAAVSLAFWIWIARQMKARGKSRWRPVFFCLPLFLGFALYGAFWFGFFASPTAAVQLHAIRLTIGHAIGSFLPFIAAGWFALGLFLLLPMVGRAA